MTLPGKSPTFSVTTNSKGHLPDGTWSGTMYFVIRGHLQSGRKWPLEQVTDQTCPVTVSDRKWPQRASGRKWPQVAVEGKWPQVTASGRRGQVTASGRKWPQVAAFGKWPQVAAFGKWPRVAASGRLFQFQIPHLMQPLWNLINLKQRETWPSRTGHVK